MGVKQMKHLIIGLQLTLIAGFGLVSCTPSGAPSKIDSPEVEGPVSLDYSFSRPETASPAIEAKLKALYEQTHFVWINEADKAVQVFSDIKETTKEAYPDNPVVNAIASNNYGVILTMTGQPDKAIPQYKQALSDIKNEKFQDPVIQDERYRLRSNLAEAKLRIDEIEEAKSYFELALSEPSPFGSALPEQIESGNRMMMTVPNWKPEYFNSPEEMFVKQSIVSTPQKRKAAMDQYWATVNALDRARSEEVIEKAHIYYDMMRAAHHPRSRYIYSADGNLASLISTFSKSDEYKSYAESAIKASNRYGYETTFDIQNITQGLINFTHYYIGHGQYDKAEEIFAEVENRIKENLEEENTNRVSLYHALQQYYHFRGKHDESLIYAKKAYDVAALRGFEKQSNLHTMHGIYANYLGFMGHTNEAFQEFEAVLEEGARYLPPDDTDLHQFQDGYASLLYQDGRFAESLKVTEKLAETLRNVDGGKSPVYSNALTLMALNLSALGQNKAALQVSEKAKKVADRIYAPESPLRSRVYNNHAVILVSGRHYDEALKVINKLIEEDVTRNDTGSTSMSHQLTKARILKASGKKEEAKIGFVNLLKNIEETEGQDNKILFYEAKLEILRLSLNDSVETAQKNLEEAWPIYNDLQAETRSDFTLGNIDRGANPNRLLKLSAILDIAVEAGEKEKAFDVAQAYLNSSLGYVQAIVSERKSIKSPVLQGKIRDRDQLESEIVSRKVDLFSSIPEGNEKTQALEGELKEKQAQLAQVKEEIGLKTQEFNLTDHSQYLTISQLQGKIKEGEAVLMIAENGRTGHVLAVTPNEFVMTRFETPMGGLSALVTKVRHSLEFDPETDAYREFDKSASTLIYKTLFQPSVLKALEGVSTLNIYATGSLSKLPLGLLATGAGSDEFLIDKFAVNTISSLQLSKTKRKSFRSSGYIGIGAPELALEPATKEITEENPLGAETGREEPTYVLMAENTIPQPYYLRGGSSVSNLSELPALPYAASELSQIKTSFDFKKADILLGAEATESRIKNTDFSRYDLAVFATHGLVAGEMTRGSEPALVLTPDADLNDENGSENDGVLKVSEILNLKMDVDWVILSACNTAAGGNETAPGLTGLASAFLYAGADSLLVSHWPVRDDAAAFLTVNTVKNSQAGLSKAEALQKAMKDLRQNKGIPNSDHPALWAPFVLVGN